MTIKVFCVIILVRKLVKTMSIGSRIKERRIEMGLTQPALAKILGVSKGTVGNYECDISAPNENVLFKLFDVLKCDANFLYQDNLIIQNSEYTSKSEMDYIKKYRALDSHGKKIINLVLDEEYARCTVPNEDKQPTIQIKHSYYKVSAGRGFPLGDGDDWCDDEIEVPDTPDTRKADYALTIKGNSMEPVFRNDDIILVKQQDAVDQGDIGIFVLNGEGYIKKNGRDRLISLNNEYEDILIEEYDDCRCVGKILGRV